MSSIDGDLEGNSSEAESGHWWHSQETYQAAPATLTERRYHITERTDTVTQYDDAGNSAINQHVSCSPLPSPRMPSKNGLRL